jgi:putative NADH-flavin reductase
MRILVVGATGGTGKHIVGQALGAGHHVTVFARDPARTGHEHPRLRNVVGELHAHQALSDAIHGHDAVISALGRGYSFKSESLIQRSVPTLISAMTAAGVRRLVFTSALGVGDSYGDAPIIARLFFLTLLRDIYADKLIGDRLIAGTDLEWTIVRPSKMTDGPLTRSYRSGERLALSGMASISRADVAHFLLHAMADPKTVGKTILISQ